MYNQAKSALKSIWGNKARSLLTVLGIVIGVASVTILVSLGQGLKKDVSSMIEGLGTNVMVVISGQIDTENPNQNQSMNAGNFVSNDILTIDDVNTIAETEGVASLSPMSLVAGKALVRDEENQISPMIMGVYSNFLETSQVVDIAEGEMFSSNDENYIIIGNDIKDDLFGEDQAVGEKLKIGDLEFEISGVLAAPTTTSLFASEFGYLAAIPYDKAKELNDGENSIYRIILKADENTDVADLKNRLTEAIKSNHEGQEDFTVFTQEDLLNVFNDFLSMATALVSAIAAISLIVGGIGIMNIMLVTVTERTKEIGIRKAIGASRTDILWQFLIESVIITLIGGVIGLVISFAGGIIIANQTPIQPVISLDVILLAIGISVAIGLIFGIWPALNAARKDPIEALRHE